MLFNLANLPVSTQFIKPIFVYFTPARSTTYKLTTLYFEESIFSYPYIYIKGNRQSCRIYSNKRRGAYFIFRASGAAVIRGQRLFKRLIPQRQTILIVQFNLLHEYFFMAYRLEANLSFGFHNSLVNTFPQV